jgi:hypothetical protein
VASITEPTKHRRLLQLLMMWLCWET